MNLFFKQYKEYIVTVFIALLGVVSVWFGIVPLQGRIQDTMDASQKLLADREMRDESIASLPTLHEQQDRVFSQEHRLNIVIAKDRIVDLVKTIEALANETGNVISIDASKDQGAVVPTKKPPVGKDGKQPEPSLKESLPSDHRLNIAITLTGKYADIIRFLRKLESMPYQTDVLSVVFSVKQKDAETSGSQRSNPFVPIAVDAADPNASVDATIPPAIESETDLPVQAVLDTIVYVNE